MRKNIRHIPILFFLVLFTLGCTLNSQVVPREERKTETSRPSSPPIDDRTLTAFITRTIPATSTASTTPKPPATPTATPNPTQSLEKSKKQFEDLMLSNSGCDLPCWWGLTPGKTSLQSARYKLTLLANLIYSTDIIPSPLLGENYGSFEFKYPFENSEDNFFLGVSYDSIQNNRTTDFIKVPMYIDFIEVTMYIDRPENKVFAGRGDDPSTDWIVDIYKLYNLMADFGEPDQVLIQGLLNGGEAQVPLFAVILIYRDKGFAIKYTGTAILQNGDLMQLCNQHSGPETILTWNSADGFPEDRIAELKRGWVALDFRSIEEVSQLDKQAFYQTMLSKDACFTTPQGLWRYTQ